MCVDVVSTGAEIVVGTPGRVIDFVESGKLPLDKVWRQAGTDEAGRGGGEGAYLNTETATCCTHVEMHTEHGLGDAEAAYQHEQVSCDFRLTCEL